MRSTHRLPRAAETGFAASCTLLVPAVALSLALGACSKMRTLGSDFEGAITMHTTAASRSTPEDMIVEVKGDKLRFDTKGPQGEAMHGVFDPKANKVVVFLDDAKTYMDLDFGKPSAAPNVDPSSSAVTKSGQHETVAGYDCEDWTVKDASGKRSELCIAQGIAYFDVSSLRPGAAGPTSPLAKEFRDKKSFPLRDVEYDTAGKEVSRMEVTKIETRKVDESAFAIPAGYKPIQLAR